MEGEGTAEYGGGSGDRGSGLFVGGEVVDQVVDCFDVWGMQVSRKRGRRGKRWWGVPSRVAWRIVAPSEAIGGWVGGWVDACLLLALKRDGGKQRAVVIVRNAPFGQMMGRQNCGQRGIGIGLL